MLKEASIEMVGMFFTNIFDSKIVNDEGEDDWPGGVSPEAVRVLALVIAMSGHAFL